jgi:threonyl-tRNA synthetase
MSEQITVTLPDGSSREYESGTTAADVAASIGRGLAKAAVAAKVGDELVDLSTPLDHDAAVAIVVPDSSEGREVLRHSTAHVLAEAVTRLFPGAQYAIGPAIADGFYYDFALPGAAHFSEDDLARIEARMREIVEADEPFEREEVDRVTALAVFGEQPYKREIIERVDPEDTGEVGEGSVISLYKNARPDGGEFVDLCRGPHVPSTKRLGAFKLTKVAGAYWRGDEKRPMLQRIYGTAWESKAALEEYLHRLEEAEKRDHRPAVARERYDHAARRPVGLADPPGAAPGRRQPLGDPLGDPLLLRPVGRRVVVHELLEPVAEALDDVRSRSAPPSTGRRRCGSRSPPRTPAGRRP